MKKAIRGREPKNLALNAQLTPQEQAELVKSAEVLAEASRLGDANIFGIWVCPLGACVRKAQHVGLCICRVDTQIHERGYKINYSVRLVGVGPTFYRRMERVKV